MEKRVICIIPARGGSKGVPKKNIKLLNGKPLVQYTYEFARKLGIFDTICLSTDSEEVLNIASRLGMDTPFLRPESISKDETSTFEVVKHAIEFYKVNLDKEFDYVCLLQPTVPFRDIEYLLPRILEHMSNSEVDTIVSFREVPHQYNPKWLFMLKENSSYILPIDKNGILKRRQDLNKYFHRDGSIYLFKVKNLVSNSIYGDFIAPIILSDSNDINIDTMKDWDKAVNFYIKKK